MPPKVSTAHLRARGPVFLVDIRLSNGRRIRRSTRFRVSEEPEARAALAEAVRQIEAGAAPAPVATWTVKRWGEQWISERKEAGKFNWRHEEGALKFHLDLELGAVPLRDVTKAMMLEWAKGLRKHERQDGKAPPGTRISGRTVHNVANTVRALFKAAAKRDLIPLSPCVWDASDLPPRDEAKDLDRLEDGFGADEVARIIRDRRIPEDRRVLYAIEFLTGMRMGEAAIRRWRDWRQEEKPLGMLVGASAWSSELLVEKPTKTRARKLVPVHPELAAMLRDWKARGWRRWYGKTPGPDDLIVPGAKGGARNSGWSSKRWRKDLELLGIEQQIHYETRSTFRSLAMAGGADLVALDLITHPTPKQAKELYTRRRLLWPRMCDAVTAIKLPQAARAQLGTVRKRRRK